LSKKGTAESVGENGGVGVEGERICCIRYM